MTRASTVLVCVGAACALSVQAASAQIVGTWKYKTMSLPPNVPAQQIEGVKQQFSQTKAVFGADKSCTLTVGRVVIKGSYSVSGHNVVIKATNFGGMTIEQMKARLQQYVSQNPNAAPMVNQQMQRLSEPIRATLGSDGKTLVMLPSTGLQGTVTLAKA